jgi:hypothetical protein
VVRRGRGGPAAGPAGGSPLPPTAGTAGRRPAAGRPDGRRGRGQAAGGLAGRLTGEAGERGRRGWAAADVGARGVRGGRLRGLRLRPVRPPAPVEHWDNALHAPRVVAANILGGDETYDPSRTSGRSSSARMVQYAGHHSGADRRSGGATRRPGVGGVLAGGPGTADGTGSGWSRCLRWGRPRDLLQGRRVIAAGGADRSRPLRRPGRPGPRRRSRRRLMLPGCAGGPMAPARPGATWPGPARRRR